MKKLLLSSVAVGALAMATSAQSAEIPLPMNPYEASPPLAFSWSGCYGGGHVGWGWSRSTFSDVPGGSSASLIDFSGLGRSVPVNGSGAVFGGQLGCDYQFNPWFVAGVSASLAGADIAGTVADPFEFGSPLQSRSDFLSDMSLRLGYAWNNVLLYGKGGAAWVRNNYSLTTSPAAAAKWGGAFISSGSDASLGGVLGVGVEWAFWGNWSTFLEYDHYFFGNDVVALNSAGFINLVNVNQNIDEVKLGVNYHFNFWPPPPYR